MGRTGIRRVIRVRFADGKLPTYLELDAHLSILNQALHADPLQLLIWAT